ncbi:hypothetical protein RhiirA4_184263 [Rhizophagus irregularis]|uniref:Uncharacterized protein n=1 Tax=Rhizophagus irregularis TaxID=588596 RepID=A0A2I1HNV0_9GLOM|nr:hypothetical protein RhiirA4_184263 [Rhizophagus irregularis]
MEVEEMEVEGMEVEGMEVDSTIIEVDNAVEEWVAIIDANNCDYIFDKKLIDMFKELKSPKKRRGDSQLDLSLSNKKSKS